VGEGADVLSPQAAIQIAIYSGLIPAVTALVVYFALGWLLPAATVKRYALGAALALGVFVGFAVSPTTKTILPTQFWEWIAFLGLLAAFVSGLVLAEGISRTERWIAYLLVAVAAAWVTVPTWERLADVRLSHVVALTAGIFLLTVLLEPLADRLSGRCFPFWLMFAAAVTSIAIMSEWSEMIGRSAALAAGALAGCGVAGLLAKSTVSLRSLTLPYSVVVGCYAYVGFVYPQPPLTPILFLPLAPLAVWICARGRFQQFAGTRGAALQFVCVLVPLLIIAAILFAGTSGEEW
jgi:hypothetical protein